MLHSKSIKQKRSISITFPISHCTTLVHRCPEPNLSKFRYYIAAGKHFPVDIASSAIGFTFCLTNQVALDTKHVVYIC